MNTAQKEIIKILRDFTLDQRYGKIYAHKYEFKKFEVTEHKYFVAVVIETGRIGDEGSLASLIARTYQNLFLGKRGGIRYYGKRGGRHTASVRSVTGSFKHGVSK